MKEFQSRRIVKIDEGNPIPILIDILIPRKMKAKKNKPKLLQASGPLRLLEAK